MDKKSIIITGADGYIGSNLVEYLKSKGYVVFPTMLTPKKEADLELDITNRQSVCRAVEKIKPDFIIHAAGLSSLAQCEKNPNLAYTINFEGCKNLVDAVQGTDCNFIFLSSDYVFDGKSGSYNEKDSTMPSTIYGKTKLKAEEYIKNTLKNFIIIRTANVYGRDGSSFFNFIVESLKRKEKIEVFGDVYFTPTYIVFLLESLIKLLDIRFTGTIHISGGEKVSRYGFAKLIAEVLNEDSSLIIKAHQPNGGLILKDSSLDNSHLVEITKNASPSIQKALHYSFGILQPFYFQFNDDRGKILGITQNEGWKEINYLESVKGCTRGRHYHQKTKEAFFILKGKMRVTLTNLETKKEKKFIAQKGDIFVIEPNTLHTFDIISDSQWINLLSQPIDQQAPDIIKYEK